MLDQRVSSRCSNREASPLTFEGASLEGPSSLFIAYQASNLHSRTLLVHYWLRSLSIRLSISLSLSQRNLQGSPNQRRSANSCLCVCLTKLFAALGTSGQFRPPWILGIDEIHFRSIDFRVSGWFCLLASSLDGRIGRLMGRTDWLLHDLGVYRLVWHRPRRQNRGLQFQSFWIQASTQAHHVICARFPVVFPSNFNNFNNSP